MPRMEPEISRTLLEGLDELLLQCGPAVPRLPALLTMAGYAGPFAGDLPRNIPLSVFARSLAVASEKAEQPCFGLRFAKVYPEGATGAFGYILLNAPDLRTMVECLRRYVRLNLDAVDIAFSETETQAELTLRFGPALDAPQKQLTEFLMSVFMLRMRKLIGDGFQPIAASFRYPEPACTWEYEDLFGRNLQFEAPDNRIVLPRGLLRTRGVNSDVRLFTLLRSIAEQELARTHPLGGAATDLCSYIVRSMSTGGARLETAAEHFGLTVRQLQSELRQLGTTFDAEVSRARRLLAERYLRETEIPMTEIALLLGFSELSAFTRAARGWFDRPPSEMRAVLRSRAPGR